MELTHPERAFPAPEEGQKKEGDRPNMKKLISLSLILALLCAVLPLAAIAETVVDHDGPTITLTVYSQLANYSGIQTGWGATLLKDKFNVELNIVPDQDGTYETRMASGNLGDIVVWGSNGEDYQNAVAKGMLLDWEEDDLAADYAPYLMENYQVALESNRNINSDGKIHGFGHNVAFAKGSHGAFFYSWDLRYDLWDQLGKPSFDTLEDMVDLFKKMKEICPTDEKGNETYAVSIWPDWDGNMVMYVKALATAYYGYDELGIGLYNPTNGEFYDCLNPDGPYMRCLKFFNKLNQEGLLDPNSMTQTFDMMSEKLKNGGTFWSIFNYAGSLAYNTDAHMAAGKYMYTVMPNQARPIAYALGNVGGNRIWTIGNDTEYPELCLEILNYLATPEGSMTMWYGPKGLMWDYNEEGGAYFTPLGALCNNDKKYDLTGVEWTSPETGRTYTLSSNFNDGCIQINNTTLAQDMVNPDSKLGETFNRDTWVSVITSTTYPIQQSWRDWSGQVTSEQYIETRPYLIMPELPYAESAKDSALTVTWSQVTKAIVNYSWRAIMAKNDGEFNFHVNEMRKQCNSYGYDQCVAWSQGEAAIKWQLTQAQQ